MEQCPIKEMEIKFQCVMDTENRLFEPVPARQVKPEWYKKLPTLLPNGPRKDLETETIKKCPAMHDWLSMGYLIRNRHSVFVFIGHDGNEPVSISLPLKDDVAPEELKKIKESETPEQLMAHSKGMILAENEWLEGSQKYGGHPAVQVKGSSWDDKMCFKFKMDFLIETPKGTSCYYLDPFLFDNPYFQTWQGVIDTDNFNQLTTNNMLIFYPKVDNSFIIPKGTPLVQIVPFVRYPWKHTVEFLSREELHEKFKEDFQGDLKKMNDRQPLDDRNEFKQVYRKNWASKKEFK
tara:strand:+ start:4185 stop:5060 length:876 start_codon:yes stop_codon:yes gene_type:complete